MNLIGVDAEPYAESNDTNLQRVIKQKYRVVLQMVIFPVESEVFPFPIY